MDWKTILAYVGLGGAVATAASAAPELTAINLISQTIKNPESVKKYHAELAAIRDALNIALSDTQ